MKKWLLSLCFYLYSCQKEQESFVIRLQGNQTFIKILSLNILSTADMSQYLPWGKRKADIFRLCEEQNGDFIAIQEPSSDQFLDLVARLHSLYEPIAKTNYTTDSVLFFRKDRFTLLHSGSLPLENRLYLKIPRVVVYGMFEERQTKKQMMIVGVHLDNKGDLQKNEIRKIQNYFSLSFQTDGPIFMVGDFNAVPESQSYRSFLSMGFHDTFGDSVQDIKFHTWPQGHPRRRIDLILYKGSQISVQNFHVLNEGYGHYSDHFAILGEFSLL